MRALLVLVLVLTACTTQPNAATSPTLSPTGSPSVTPTATPTTPPTASPSPIPLPSIAQLSAPSGTVVWALVAGTHIFRSSDRGNTWVERSLPQVSLLDRVEIAFGDDSNGLLLSSFNAPPNCGSQVPMIWRTSDGSASWPKLTANGVADALCKSGLTSPDANHAFLTASMPGTAPLIYRTTDGGANWTASAPLPTPPNIASQGATSLTITGRPRGFGTIVLIDGGGGQQTKDVLRSTDGGATFSYASTAPTFDPVTYVTATRWLQLGAPGSSMETADGGATWHAYTTDYSQAAPIAPDVVFGDAMVGYATVRGALQRTTDGGAHWTTIKTPGT